MTTLSAPYAPRPYLLDRDTAPAFWLVATLWMPMATGFQTANHFSLLEQWMPSGLGPPTHRHARANEGFYVLEGTVAYHADGQTVRGGPGTFVHLPRGLPHSFAVDTAEAHVLNFYTPAGFELVVISCARAADARRRPSMAESMPPAREQVEILSRLFGQEAVTALPFAQPSEDALMATAPGAWRIGALKVATADAATPVEAFGLVWRALATAADTDGTYDLCEVAAPAGAGMPPRLLGQDEAVYVLEGALDLTLDGERQRAKTGAFAYMPAGSACAWAAADRAPARVLVFHVPAGFEQALAREGADEAHVRTFLEAAGTRFLPAGA